MVNDDTRNNLIVIGLIGALAIIVGVLIYTTLNSAQDLGVTVQEGVSNVTVQAATQTEILNNVSLTLDDYIAAINADREQIKNDTTVALQNQSDHIDKLVYYLNLTLTPNMTYSGLGEGK